MLNTHTFIGDDVDFNVFFSCYLLVLITIEQNKVSEFEGGTGAIKVDKERCKIQKT